MNITSAFIEDPRVEGQFKEPYLQLEVDEALHVTNRYDIDDYAVTIFGPFITVDELDDGTSEWMPANIGKFNTTSVHREKLVDVQVLMPKEVLDCSIGLDRARRLLRKHADNWELILDDLAAQRGEILWRLRQAPLACISCGRPAGAEAFHNGVHLPYCPDHMREHTRSIRNLRIASNS